MINMFFNNSLLSFQNTKFLKTQDTEWFIVGLSLLPSKYADGKTNLCKFSSPSCVKSCIAFSGQNARTKTIESKRRKTLDYLHNRKSFLDKLFTEVFYWQKMTKAFDKKLALRLNTYSDIDWSKELVNGKNVFETFDCQAYDYTKDYNKVSTYSNYHLTYSYDQTRHRKAIEVLKRGNNIAVVFEKELPKKFEGFNVINGNDSDLRFLDSKNVVVGLTYKNKTTLNSNNAILKKESTFVVKKDNSLNKVKLDIEW